MIFADIIPGGEIVYRQIFFQIVVDVLQNIRICESKEYDFLSKNILLFQKNTVYIDHKLQK